MAIKFNVSNMNGPAFLAKVGVDKMTIAKMLAEGWSIVVETAGVKFKHPLPGGKTYTSYPVPVDMAMLGKIQSGTANSVKVLALKAALESAIENCHKTLPNAFVPSADPVQTTAEPDPKAKAKPAAPGKAWPLFDTTKMKWATPVKLAEATQMYQPVHGTSGGSRYFVVGANKDLRIAARFQGGSLSVRIEGPAMADHSKAIADCGFDLHLPAKAYASLHLTVGHDPVLANKTLGAVLLGLGLQLDTPMPNVQILKAVS